MNHSPRRQSRRSHPTLITVVIVFAQITLLLVATMAAIQPTPQMVQAAAQQAGLTGWFANGANRLIELVQPLWGAPAKALAQIYPRLVPARPLPLFPTPQWVALRSPKPLCLPTSLTQAPC